MFDLNVDSFYILKYSTLSRKRCIPPEERVMEINHNMPPMISPPRKSMPLGYSVIYYLRERKLNITANVISSANKKKPAIKGKHQHDVVILPDSDLENYDL